MNKEEYIRINGFIFYLTTFSKFLYNRKKKKNKMDGQQQQRERTVNMTPNIPSQSDNRGSSLRVNNRAATRGDNAVAEKSFDTLINCIFTSTQNECAPNAMTSICGYHELPCFFQFLNCCSPKKDDLVYGLFCLRHTGCMSRTFVTMVSENTVQLQPVSLKKAKCERNMFLWSFLTNVNYGNSKELISFMELHTNESNMLAKFIRIVSEPYGSQNNSEEYQRLHQYLSTYCQYAIKCLESIPDRHKIIIPIDMTTNFINKNKGNNLLDDIIRKANEKKISVQQIQANTSKYFVPLTMLNILDQLQILSFRIRCGAGRVVLAPNVGIVEDCIRLGYGIPIRNYANKIPIDKLLNNYSESVYKTIVSVHGNSVHINLDALVLFAVPENPNSFISPQVFVAKRKFLLTTFDVEGLSPQLCF